MPRTKSTGHLAGVLAALVLLPGGCLDKELGIPPPSRTSDIAEVDRTSTLDVNAPLPDLPALCEAEGSDMPAPCEVGGSEMLLQDLPVELVCPDSCGDGTCDKACGENQSSCPKDCCDYAACGNGKCKRNGTCAENGENCPQDCCVCGDGICEAACGETELGTLCEADC